MVKRAVSFHKSLKEEPRPLEVLNTTDDYAYDDYLVRILQTTQRTLNGRVFKVCKVQWSNQMKEDASWENEDQMKIEFSLECNTTTLEAKIDLSQSRRARTLKVPYDVQICFLAYNFCFKTIVTLILRG